MKLHGCEIRFTKKSGCNDHYEVPLLSFLLIKIKEGLVQQCFANSSC